MTTTPTKKEWCGHIKWMPLWTDKTGWGMLRDGRLLTYVPVSWTRCPICGKERPKG